MPLVLVGASAETQARAGRWAEFMQRLARRLRHFVRRRCAAGRRCNLIVRGEVAALPLKGVIDLAAERARLDKEMAKVDADIARVEQSSAMPTSSRARPRRSSKASARSATEAEARKAKIAEARKRLEAAV